MPGIEGYRPGESHQEARANLEALLGCLAQATTENTRGVDGSDIAPILTSMQKGEVADVAGLRNAGRGGIQSTLVIAPEFKNIGGEEAERTLLQAVGE